MGTGQAQSELEGRGERKVPSVQISIEHPVPVGVRSLADKRTTGIYSPARVVQDSTLSCPLRSMAS